MATAYFAYGSNMSRAQMAYRCPHAAAVGAAVLPAHRFIINRRGYATVVPDPEAAVHGVLWMITAEDERELDRYEGVARGRGLYRKERRAVRLDGVADGRTVDALLYVAADASRGTPAAAYLEQVISGAESHGLPESYVAELRAWRAG